jgi:hypothetical protein
MLTINRNALIPVKRASSGVLPLGRGVVFTGSFSPDNFALVDSASGTDAQIDGVTCEISPDDANVGYIVLVGLSLVQVRIGSAGVTFKDKLNLQDNTGVWQTASLLSQNCYYTALQTKAAGTLCWAAPIASRPA